MSLSFLDLVQGEAEIGIEEVLLSGVVEVVVLVEEEGPEWEKNYKLEPI